LFKIEHKMLCLKPINRAISLKVTNSNNKIRQTAREDSGKGRLFGRRFRPGKLAAVLPGCNQLAFPRTVFCMSFYIVLVYIGIKGAYSPNP
jgi:hypothetical protein